MRYLESFTTLTNKSILIIHGYGGGPTMDRIRVLSQRGYTVYYPYIDFDEEWEKDKCRSIISYMVERYRGVDVVMGFSLGGYLAYILANEFHKPCVLVNPALNRDTTRLDIKHFDVDINITNPRTEVFFGEFDTVVPKEYVENYLNSVNYKYIDIEVKSMEHRTNLSQFRNILNKSKIIK